MPLTAKQSRVNRKPARGHPAALHSSVLVPRYRLTSPSAAPAQLFRPRNYSGHLACASDAVARMLVDPDDLVAVSIDATSGPACPMRLHDLVWLDRGAREIGASAYYLVRFDGFVTYRRAARCLTTGGVLLAPFTDGQPMIGPVSLPLAQSARLEVFGRIAAVCRLFGEASLQFAHFQNAAT